MKADKDLFQSFLMSCAHCMLEKIVVCKYKYICIFILGGWNCFLNIAHQYVILFSFFQCREDKQTVCTCLITAEKVWYLAIEWRAQHQWCVVPQ